ncbi:uncharacterized protein AAGF69_005530 [Amazona ochrocephala]
MFPAPGFLFTCAPELSELFHEDFLLVLCQMVSGGNLLEEQEGNQKMLQVTSSITASLQKHTSRGWSLVRRRRKPSLQKKGISVLTQTLVRKTEHIVCDGSLHQNGSGAKLRLRKKFSLPSDERSACFLPLLPLVSVHTVLRLLWPHHLQGPIPLFIPKGLVAQPLIIGQHLIGRRLKFPSLNCEGILPCRGVVHRQSGFHCVPQMTLEIKCRKQNQVQSIPCLEHGPLDGCILAEPWRAEFHGVVPRSAVQAARHELCVTTAGSPIHQPHHLQKNDLSEVKNHGRLCKIQNESKMCPCCHSN